MPELKLALIVEAIDRFTEPMHRISDALSGPAKAIQAGMGQGMGALAQFGDRFAGLAATVGAGFEIREIIKDEDAFARLGIDAGISSDQVAQLKGTIFSMAEENGIAINDLSTAFRGVFNLAGIDAAQRDVGALATTIQRLGGYGPEVGNLFGTLERFGGIKGPAH